MTNSDRRLPMGAPGQSGSDGVPAGGDSSFAGRVARRLGGRWAVAIVVLLFLTPFVNKAMTIDDPLFVWQAQQIQKQPLDPYGFSGNWFGVEFPMFQFNIMNPPLTSYWLALAGTVSWSDAWLHLAMLPFGLLTVLGTMQLARRMGADPFWAGLLVLGTAAFLVSATNVMCDVMMVCLMIWSVVCWVEGLERTGWRSQALWLTAAGLLAAAAFMTKYFAIGLVPMLGVYTLIRLRRFKVPVAWQWLALLIPVATVVLWSVWTWKTYHDPQTGEGWSHFLKAADYTKMTEAKNGVDLYRFLPVMTFLGGCLMWPLALVLWRARWTGRLLMVIWAYLGGFLYWHVLVTKCNAGSVASPLRMALAGLFFAAGVAAVMVVVRFILDHYREPMAWLLVMWVAGTLLFAGVFNWTVAARNILPLVPPVALMAAYPWKRPQSRTRRERKRAGTAEAAAPQTLAWYRQPLPMAALTGLLVAAAAGYGDYSWANGVRDQAAVVAEKYQRQNRPVYFQGHWGFQYYMQLHGCLPHNITVPETQLVTELVNGRSVERLEFVTDLPPRAVVIVPLNNCNPNLTSLKKAGWVMAELSPDQARSGVIVTAVGVAGFYCHILGLLPMTVAERNIYVYEAWMRPGEIQPGPGPVRPGPAS